MANGKLAAFEIKSERDTLERLEGQLGTYLRFFEQVTVVCAEKHVEAVKVHAPEAVGIIAVSPAHKLAPIRAPKQVNVALESWLSFLPVDQLRGLLKLHGLRATGSRPELESMASSLKPNSVRAAALTYLKGRHSRIEKRIEQKNARRAPRQAEQPAAERLRLFIERHGTNGGKAIPRRVSRT